MTQLSIKELQEKDKDTHAFLKFVDISINVMIKD